MSQTRNEPALAASASVNYDSRIAALEEQLASLKQMPGVEATGNCCCGSCDCCSTSGLTGGAELTFMQPQGSIFAVSFLSAFANLTLLNADFKVETAPRFWVGYETDEDLGWRVSYWRFSADADINPPDAFREFIEAETVDFENIFTETLFNTELSFTAGARYANYIDSATLSNGAGAYREFEGGGATAGLWVTRPFPCSISLVGGMRGSFLWGENISITRNPGAAAASPPQIRGRFTQIYDVQLGIQWEQDLANGARLFARTGLEAQEWDLQPVSREIFDQDAGFIGGTFALGINR